VFDIAFSELFVIGVVALVVLGPKRLPEMARAAGRWTARIRRFVDDVKRDMGSELRREELAQLRQVQQQISETKQLFEHTAGSAFAGIAEIRPPESAPDYQVKALPDAAASVAAPKKRAAKSVRKQSAKLKKAKKIPVRYVRTGRKSRS
jgi:sec-independent protein translocase protein TatB